LDWQGWFSLVLTFSSLAILLFTSASPHIVMMGALVLLSITGVLTATEALLGFANPGLITIAAMFVVAAGLNASGGIELLVNKALGQPENLRSAMLKIFFSPSKLMIPLSYGAILGGTLTLIGSSTNLIINGEYQVLTGAPGFSLFFITAIGLPVTLAGVIFMLLWFPRILPDRQQETVFRNMREFTVEVCVTPNGALAGKTVQQARLRQLPRIYLAEIERDGTIVTAVPSEAILKGGDRLIFTGDTEAIVEAVVSPYCAAVGLRIREARFVDRYGAVVLAVARNGERIKGNLGTIKLKAGDTLLLEARPTFISRQRYNKDFLLINDTKTEPLRHKKAYLAWLILVSVVGLAGTGATSMLNASLLGAGLMVASGCCSGSAAERSLDLKVLITIGAAFSLGMALKKTGVASLLADSVLALSSGEVCLNRGHNQQWCRHPDAANRFNHNRTSGGQS